MKSHEHACRSQAVGENHWRCLTTGWGGSRTSFEYDAEFARSGIQVAPIVMPLSRRVYRFPELSRPTFRGLPGLLADSLPDKFGNALLDAWLVSQGRQPDFFNAVERLCYTGERGMGGTIGDRPQLISILTR